MVLTFRQYPFPQYHPIQNFPFSLVLYGDGTLLYRDRNNAAGNRLQKQQGFGGGVTWELLSVKLSEEEMRLFLVEFFKTGVNEMNGAELDSAAQVPEDMRWMQYHFCVQTETLDWSDAFSQYGLKKLGREQAQAFRPVNDALGFINRYKNTDAVPYDRESDPKAILNRTWPSGWLKAVKLVLRDTPEEMPAEEDLQRYLEEHEDVLEEAKSMLREGIPTEEVPEELRGTDPDGSDYKRRMMGEGGNDLLRRRMEPQRLKEAPKPVPVPEKK
jgi:hypothetical protein